MYFVKQTLMTIIHFYHDLQETTTKMSLGVTIFYIPNNQMYYYHLLFYIFFKSTGKNKDIF